MIELRKITWDNWEECLNLEVADEQKNFVAPNDYSIAQAYVHLTRSNRIFRFASTAHKTCSICKSALCSVFWSIP